MTSPAVEGIITDNEVESIDNVDRLILGCLNIYGVVPLKSFVDAVLDNFDGTNSIMPVSRYVAQSDLVTLCRRTHKGITYLVSPFVEDFNDLLELRREYFKDVRRYNRIAIEEAMNAGEGSPFCCAGLGTPEGQEMVAMLKSIGYKGEDLKKKLNEIWMYSQYVIDEDSTELLFDLINEKLDNDTEFEKYSYCIGTIADYANATPKWLLKGRTPNDANLMKIAIKVDDLDKELKENPFMSLYTMGLAVHPTAPDDPCPCGSNLSYRNCHGKYWN